MWTILFSFLWATTALAVAVESPNTATDFISRGMQRFRDNKIRDSIRDFQRAAEIDPEIEPHLWQLGISFYYAGDFQQGRELFESHQTVNRHDVENAAWHFICAARTDGVKAARKTLIPIETARDTRVPMAEVYQFYAGQGSAEDVLKAAERAAAQSRVDSEARAEQALMYAHLYLGLFYEVDGKANLARDHLRKAAAAKLKQHYMHDVAKVHVLQRKWNQ